jgi:hypothetical protein
MLLTSLSQTERALRDTLVHKVAGEWLDRLARMYGIPHLQGMSEDVWRDVLHAGALTPRGTPGVTFELLRSALQTYEEAVAVELDPAQPYRLTADELGYFEAKHVNRLWRVDGTLYYSDGPADRLTSNGNWITLAPIATSYWDAADFSGLAAPEDATAYMLPFTLREPTPGPPIDPLDKLGDPGDVIVSLWDSIGDIPPTYMQPAGGAARPEGEPFGGQIQEDELELGSPGGRAEGDLPLADGDGPYPPYLTGAPYGALADILDPLLASGIELRFEAIRYAAFLQWMSTYSILGDDTDNSAERSTDMALPAVFTVACWFFIRTDGPIYIVDIKGAGAFNFNRLRIFMTGSVLTATLIADDGTSVSRTGTAESGEWHLVVVTYAADGTFSLYIDSATPATIVSFKTFTTTDLHWMKAFNNANHFDGYMHTIGVWSSAVPASRIADWLDSAAFPWHKDSDILWAYNPSHPDTDLLSIIPDWTDSRKHLTPSGMTTSDLVVFDPSWVGSGKSALLDGSNERLLLSDGFDTDFPVGDRTVELFFKATADTEGYMWAVGDGTTQNYETLRYTPTGSFFLYVRRGGSFVSYNHSLTVSLDVWYHAAFRYVASTGVYTLYLNGVAETAGTLVHTMIYDKASIGSRSDLLYHFAGNVAQVAIYSSAKTNDQVVFLSGAAYYDRRQIADCYWYANLASAGVDLTGGTGNVPDLIGDQDFKPQNTEAGDLVRDAPWP